MSPAPEAPYADSRIVVHDITEDLPQHPTRAYRLRSELEIERVYIHHTGGRVRRGLAGPEATAGYIVRDRPHGRGWPGMPYHVFIPYDPEIDAAGRLVVYQTQRLDAWSYHTGGKDRQGRSRNKHGLGVVCQGCFVSRADADQGPFPGQPTPYPSAAQQTAVGAVWDWLRGLYALPRAALSCHAWAGKPTCPGDWLERWCRMMAARR